MIAAGRFARISAADMVQGTISEYTRHSRTRRAINCAYWAPKSTTRTVSKSLSRCTVPPSLTTWPWRAWDRNPWRAVPPPGRWAVLPRGRWAVPPPGRRAAPPLPDRRAAPPPPDRRAAPPPPGRRAVLPPGRWAAPPPGRRAVPPPPGRLIAVRADPDPGDTAAIHLGDGQPAPGDLHRLMVGGQLAKRGQHVARDGLVGTFREHDPGLLGELIEVQQAVHFDLATEQLLRLPLVHVVLILDVADQLLDEILKRDDACRAAILVHHDGQVGPVPAHLRQGGQDRLAGRQLLHRPAHLADGDRPRHELRIQQVAYVDEADHVVVGLLVHGEPGVRRARHDLRHLGQRRRGGDELHLGPRHQHLADLPVRGFEHLRHDVPLIGAQRLVTHDQVAEFLLGHHPAPRLRVTAEDPPDQVRRPGQQPDQRAGQHRDPVQRRGRDQRHPLSALQREPLGGELAEHQGEDRDRPSHHDQ